MARRFIGDANIYILYYDRGPCAMEGDYRGSIVVPVDEGPPAVWKFKDPHAPKCGFGPGIAFDSSEAYDQMAQSAVSFGSYYTTMNRNDEEGDLDGYPSGEVADIINDAVSVVLHGGGSYEVWRSKEAQREDCRVSNRGDDSH